MVPLRTLTGSTDLMAFVSNPVVMIYRHHPSPGNDRRHHTRGDANEVPTLALGVPTWHPQGHDPTGPPPVRFTRRTGPRAPTRLPTRFADVGRRDCGLFRF